MSKLWQKRMSEKRVYTYILYGVDADKMTILLFHVTKFVLNAFMQHLGVNCGGIWRFELGFFIWVYLGFFA